MVHSLYPMHMPRAFPLIATLVILAVFLGGCAGKTTGTVARDEAAAQKVVDDATKTLRSHLEGEHRQSVSELIARAKGIMVIPGMGSVSFFFSLGGGNALLMARSDSDWSGPVFLSKAAGGLGIQAGVTRTSGMILYMNEEDVKYVLETGALLQAQAAITFLNADFEGNRTPEFFETGEVVFIGDTSGLYAGIGLSGGGLSNRNGLNAVYHGAADGEPENILYKVKNVPDGARHLVDLLEMADTLAQEKQKDETEAPSN